MNHIDKIIIIIPAHNEEESIKGVIEEAQSSSPYDIVVVDDGSQDNTNQIAKNMGVAVVSHPINLGAGAAIQTGLKYAFNRKYDAAVVVDGDGQHDPAEISKLIDELQKKTIDIVIGSRFLIKGRNKVHWFRRTGMLLFSSMISLMAHYVITDATSGFRAFNKKAIEFLSREMPSDFPDADLLLLLLLSGFKIIEIPVNIRPRVHGHSMYTGLRCIYYPFKVFISILAVLLRKYVGKGGVR